MNCALALCPPAAQAQLVAFVGARFRRLVERHAPAATSRRGASCPDADSCWHAFESFVTIRSTRAGKRYKDWLFDRVACSDDSPLDVLQGGGTLILRDVVREHLRHERVPRRVSLVAALAAACRLEAPAQAVLSAEPDPASQAALREYERLAREHAGRHFPLLSLPVRVALLAGRLGVALSHPWVEDAAGRGKSALHAAFQAWLKTAVGALRRRYRDDPVESQYTLALMVVSALQERAEGWARTRDCPPRVRRLLGLGEGVADGTGSSHEPAEA